MKKLMIVIAVLLMAACTKEIINQPGIPAQKELKMGLQLNTYGGFTAAQLKARASIPIQSDIAVGSNYIICSSVDIPSEIRDIIGEGSNDLGTIYTSAKVNKWSGFGPREWYISGSGILNRPISNPYDMSNFCGYNHNAVEPIPFNSAFEYTKGATGSTITQSIAVKIKMGEYNWERLGATHCKVIIYDGASIYAQSGILPINVAGNFLTFDNVSFTIQTGTIGVTEYVTKIYICTSDGSELAELPQFGNVTCTIVAATAYILSVKVAGNVKTFTMLGTADNTSNGNIITRSGRYTGIGTVAGKTLSNIVYEVLNKTTNAVESTLTITNFNTYEYPTMLYDMMINDVEYFSTAQDRLIPTSTQYLRITMNYI